MKRSRWISVGSIVFLTLGALLLAGTIGVTAFAEEACSPCADEGKIEKMITPKAQLEAFSCYMKEWKGAEVLHFKVAIKNVTDTPKRYRVQIFLDNGKAVGGLIPRKTKKGLVKPGATATFSYPVKGMTQKPGSILLRIATGG